AGWRVVMADLPEEDLSVVERQAFNLAQAGIQLDQARLGGDDNGTLARALEHNLQVWIEIGILIKSPESQLAENVRDNILKLRDFISDTTMQHGVDIRESTLNTLININLQISEGLLEGARGRAG
ncbi:MAG: flagellar biosynthesis regulator FlaF, partial [Rhodospirillales bacterium]|nr:flagellar biosynthesis regulator FlaF [Rhodospirillales bacterium]